MVKLTSEQLSSYWDDGCLLPVRVFEESEALALASEFAALESKFGDDQRLRHDYSVYCRENFHVVSTAAAELAHDKRILDAVEQLIGPDLLVWMVELIVKGPHTDKVITMHQDLTYWGLTQPDKLVSAWVALSEVTLDNGAMRFVRGSHKQGVFAHEDTYDKDNLLTRGQRVMAEWEPADEIADELHPGEMSLHHGLMFHGSGPNITDEPRVAIVVRFISPDVSQTISKTDHVMTVRGKNRTKNLVDIARPTSDFSPESLDLYDVLAESQAEAFGDGAEQEISYLR